MSPKSFRIIRRFVVIGLAIGYLLIMVAGFVKGHGGNYLPWLWAGIVLAVPVSLAFLTLVVVSLLIFILCWLFELKQEQLGITTAVRERMKRVLDFDWFDDKPSDARDI